MKLLYVLGSYYPAQMGGPNNTIHWQGKYLTKSGHNVEVAALKDGITDAHMEKFSIKLNSKTDIEGVSAVYFDYLIHRLLSFRLYFWLLKNVARFDLVQLTSYFFPVSWIAALICIIKGVPFSIAPRGELEPNAMVYSSSKKKFLHKLFLKKLFNKAEFVLITSKNEQGYSKNYFRENMNFDLLPNYMDIPDSLPCPPSDKKNILYLGRLHPKKGIENLIEAYIKLPENITAGNNLIIAGKGDETYTGMLKDMASKSICKDKIIFAGHVEGDDKTKLYSHSKIFVLPSHSENFGNVVVEALSCGTPVVASIYTPWEILNEKNAGVWTDNAPEKISKELESLLAKNTEDYSVISRNALELSRDYSIKDNIKNVESLYEKYTKS